MMHKFLIEGENRLLGEVEISGSKNAALPILAATLLSAETHVLQNVPQLADIETMSSLLRYLGCIVTRENDTLLIDARAISHVEATYDIVRKMRASTLVLGPLVARFGRGRVSLPGGCAIGARPIDLHLKGLEALGATICLEHGYVDVVAPANGLVGNRIILDMPSVGATEHLMTTATLAKGTTVIENAAREPEIVELANVLIGMGAKVSGAGTSQITIEGVEHLGQMRTAIRPDRIESGTFIAAAAITGGDVLLKQVSLKDLESVIQHFGYAGCELQPQGEVSSSGLCDLRIRAPKKLRACDIKTAPFPGFATDMQAQWMACMTLASGTSHIEENIFENRFMHVSELMRMGAQIELHGNLAIVKGVERLSGAPVMATDLRASASLVLAALAAQGQTEILRIYHLDRGYVALEKKLNALGAKVLRQEV